MSARIIILEQPDADPPKFNVVYWATVPAGREEHWADADFVSQYKDVDPVDLARLRAGQLAERWENVSFPPGTSQAVVDANLEAGWQTWQDEVTNKDLWSLYGRTWDGQDWTP